MRDFTVLRGVCIAVALSLAALPGSATTIDAPKVSVTKLPAPLPLPYDENADGHAALANAIAHAKTTGKFVLLDLGGNWCPDCRVLAGTLDLPQVKPSVEKTFEVVPVDVGRMNKNLDIAAHYGVKIHAVPTVIIIDPAGHFVNAGNPTALSDARSMSPQAIVDTIYGWINAPKTTAD